MSISIFLVACCVQAAGAAYTVYTTTLAALDSSGVEGEVTVIITSTGFLGVGSWPATGFAAGKALGTVNIYDGTSCGGTQLIGDSETSFTAVPGNGGFSFSEASSATGVAGKPFIVQDDTGAPVACGLLTFQTGVMSASLAAVGTSGVTGELTIFKTATMIIGAGRAIGLEASMTASNKGTESNSRGTAVHSGNACTDEASQGGNYYDTSGSDPWASIGYSTTSSSGSADFVFSVTTSLLDISMKPFIVRNNAGVSVACGVIAGAYEVFTADLVALDVSGTTSGVTGDATVFVTPDGLLGVGSASGLTAGKVAIHAGTGCSTTTAIGAQLDSTNLWTSSTFPKTEPDGDATYSFSVKTLAKDIQGKPFIVSNNAGDLVACGTLAHMTGSMTGMTLGMAMLAPTVTGSTMPNGLVTIATTATKIVGAGRATGLGANLAATNSDAANARKVAVVSGDSCSNPQVAEYFAAGGSDPWMTTGYSSTNSGGTATFVFSITTSAVDIVDKPFVLYNNAGARAACGRIVGPSMTTGSTTVESTTAATAGSTSGSTSGATTTVPATTGDQTTSGCSGMPTFGMIVVVFAGMLSICAEL